MRFMLHGLRAAAFALTAIVGMQFTAASSGEAASFREEVGSKCHRTCEWKNVLIECKGPLGVPVPCFQMQKHCGEKMCLITQSQKPAPSANPLPPPPPKPVQQASPCPPGKVLTRTGVCAGPGDSPCPPGKVLTRTGVCAGPGDSPCPAGKVLTRLGVCAGPGDSPCPRGLVLTRVGQCVRG